jgi:hypothetical protein
MSSESTITVILVHSDDLIIASNTQDNLKAIKAQLFQAFDGVDQGELTSFCGVEIKATPDSMELSMDYYWWTNITEIYRMISAYIDVPYGISMGKRSFPFSVR